MNTETLFFSITSALPFPVVATTGDPGDPRILYANEAFESMTEYPLDELRGNNPNMLQGEMTNREVIDRLKNCLRERKPFEGCTYNYRKSGGAYRLKWCIVPFSAGGQDFYVAVQQELNAGNSKDDATLTDAYVVTLTRNLTAFFRNSLSIYQHLHSLLRTEDSDELPKEEIINMLLVRDSVTLAASNLTDYLLRPVAA